MLLYAASVVFACATLVLAIGTPSKGARSAQSEQPMLAFAGVHWSSGLAPAGSRLYVIRSDGGGMAGLTARGTWSDTDPAWSPDGRAIAFGRQEKRGWRLYVVAANGQHPRAVTKFQALAESPSWSPDGKHIVFVQLPFGLPRTGCYAQQLYVVALTGTRSRQLTRFSVFKGGAGRPEWSPDGKRILFSGRRSGAEHARTDIWVVGTDGSGLRRIVAGAEEAAWSPDGSMIVFVRHGDVFTSTAAGRGVRRLTHTSAADSSPSWSPDGMQIAFTRLQRAARPSQDTQRLFLIGADASGLNAVTRSDPSFWADAPAWRPELAASLP